MPSRIEVRGAAALLCALLLVSPLAFAQSRGRARNRPGEIDRGVIPVRGQVVFVGGYSATSDDGFFVRDLRPRRQKVHVSQSGYGANTTELEVRAGTTTRLDVTLVPGPAGSLIRQYSKQQTTGGQHG